MQAQLTEKDRETVALVEAGNSISVLNAEANAYRTLVSKILFQFADSEMAGAAGYAPCLNIAPDMDDRLDLARLTYEKVSLAKRSYALIENCFEINVRKYSMTHSWEMRINRSAQLGYRRGSSDKRLNALLYPLQSWADVAVFTYLMAYMACLQLKDFCSCSFKPWADLASEFLPLEDSHAKIGLAMIRRLSSGGQEQKAIESTLEYWYPRVLQSFGPPSGQGNKLYRLFGLKHESNEEMLDNWSRAVGETCRSFGLSLSGAIANDASACD